MQPAMVCPACGAPIDPKHRFDETYTCPYCGTQTYFGSQKALALDTEAQEGSDSLRDSAALAQVLSRFSLGQTGQIRIGGQWKPYSVTGRLLYEYSGGYWNEWYLNVEGSGYWLQEDEGLYVLFFEHEVTGHYLKELQEYYTLIKEQLELAEAGVDVLFAGRPMPVLMDGMSPWVTLDMGWARLVGYEGMLPIDPASRPVKVLYADGASSDGHYYSLEIEEDGSSASINEGYPLEFEDIRTSDEIASSQGVRQVTP